MLVSTLLERFEGAGLNPADQKQLPMNLKSHRIGHLAYDSREVQEGGAFFAIRGGSTDGHLFIDKAVKEGAILVVCEEAPEQPVGGAAIVTVNDSRRALAEAAACFYDDPSRELTMVGITGTNGKTTTAHLCHSLVQALSKSCGIVGTLGLKIGDVHRDLKLTTPDPVRLHEAFREMVDAGCEVCVMEVSSHALEQRRTSGIQYDAAVFMNLTQDHLDYHGSTEAYFKSKKLLFDELPPDATAIYNADDEHGRPIVDDTRANIQSFGRASAATYRVSVLENSLKGLLLTLDGEKRRFNLVGEFNAYNLAAAYAVGRVLGFERTEVLNALADAPPVRGRFEQLVAPDGLQVIVDYAHTPDALENVLQTVRGAAPDNTRLWCVFGCGGDRDRGKRPKMGRIAEALADTVVITSDNPRSEDPDTIINDVLAGLQSADSAHVIPDRREAIQFATEGAASGDVVVIAGKGHETQQEVNGTKHHFDDRQEVSRHFTKRVNRRN